VALVGETAKEALVYDDFSILNRGGGGGITFSCDDEGIDILAVKR